MPRRESEPVFTKREVLLWLTGQDEDDIRAVLMAIGRDAEVEELELHGEPEQLVAQLEGPAPRLDSLAAAIEDALGLAEDELGRQVRGECEAPADVELGDLEVDLDEVDEGEP